jgi:signal peptidase I
VGQRRRRLRPSALRVFLALSGTLAVAFDAAIVVRRARRGPWRAEVAEESMAPALRPGDWLLLDPTGRRWPRPGSIVVVCEPGTGILAIKRVAARGRPAGRGRGLGVAGPEGTERGARGRDAGVVTLPDGSVRHLEPREAWVLGDASSGSIDSRAYGPLDADALVARAWFRYGPLRRVGRLR